MNATSRPLSAAMLLVMAGVVHAAPSFDCAKAGSDVERAICNSEPLSQLDSALADAFKSRLNAKPEQRAALVADQRRWLKQRDQKCLGGRQGPGGAVTECLTDQYRSRLAWLQGAQSKVDDQRFCQEVVDRYVPVARDHPGQTIVSVLSRLPAAGISAAQDARQSIDEKQLVEWGRKQKPAVTFAPDFLKALRDDGIWDMGKADFRQMPDTPLYTISSVQGTAHCYSGVFFMLRSGSIAPVDAAANASDDGSCGTEPEFARVDGSPVLLVEQYDWTPSMAAAVTVVPWVDDHFGGSCTASFSFAPDFSKETLNAWDQHCDGADCKGLEDEALRLIVAAQKGPQQLLKDARTRLTSLQMQSWQQAIDADAAAASAADDTPPQAHADDPSRYTDSHPLRVPVVFRGRLYDVALGHFTIGWRVFADWGASFKRVEQGKLVDVASFAVGMRKGAVIDSSPKQSPSQSSAVTSGQPEAH